MRILLDDHTAFLESVNIEMGHPTHCEGAFLATGSFLLTAQCQYQKLYVTGLSAGQLEGGWSCIREPFQFDNLLGLCIFVLISFWLRFDIG